MISRRDVLKVGAASVAFGAMLGLAWIAVGAASAVLGLTAIVALILLARAELLRRIRDQAIAERQRDGRRLRRHLRHQRAYIRGRTLRRPRRLQRAQAKMLSRETQRAYSQIEALFSLFASLEIREPLPPMRSWAVSPDFANLIVSEIRARQPGLILELGSGISTVIAGYCVQQLGRGRVVALEHEARFVDATAATLERHGLSSVASVIHATLQPISLRDSEWRWYAPEALDGLEDVDVLIVDGPPTAVQELARYPALPVLASRMAGDAVVLVDDYALDDVREMVARWIADDPGLTVEELPLEKGGAVIRRTGAAGVPARREAQTATGPETP